MTQFENAVTPFLDTLSFEFEQPTAVADLIGHTTWQNDESPFKSVYEMEGIEQPHDPRLDERAELLNELYDEEFNYAIYEVMNRVADLHELQFEQQINGQHVSTAGRVQRLYEHCVPFVRETDLFFDAVNHEMGEHSENETGDAAVEQFINQYQTQQPLPPEFEQLWGWAKKKLKKVYKKAKKYVGKKARQGWNYAKKKAMVGARWLARKALSRLKKYIGPWIEGVAKKAIKRIPQQYRPILIEAAAKLGINVEEQKMEHIVASSAEIQHLQYEFNHVVADLFLADDEVQQERVLANALTATDEDNRSIEQLHHARQQFKDGLVGLGEGEEPTQLVEEFIPAVLPFVKLGIKFYGRGKLVRLIAGYVARLIRKFVPRQYLRPLSQAIVDAGLRLINLEASEEDVDHVALEAIADTVEETVRRVAALPEHILENEAMLEGFVLEAFEAAATANLPPILPANVYEARPELRESMMFNGVWAKQPLQGQKLYKKYTHVFDTLITPHKARKIKTWGGKTLADSMRRRIGRKMRLKARAHIYQATPGTWLSRIAKNETGVAGLGSSGRESWSQLMPLTEEAAAILLGEPQLGRSMPDQYTASPLNIGVGQRFYYLEFPDEQFAPPSLTPTRCCNAHLVLNFAQNSLSSAIFLSEAEAQQIAIVLRQKMPLGATLIVLNRAIQEGMARAFGNGALHQIKVVHGGLGSQAVSAAALNWLPAQLLRQLQIRLVQWQLQQANQLLQDRPNAFVAAVDDPANGVTLRMQFRNPPGLSEMGRFLAGNSLSLANLRVADRLPQADVTIHAGYDHA